MNRIKTALPAAAFALPVLLAPATAQAGMAGEVVDISGMQSWDLDGSPFNERQAFDVPFNGFGVILRIDYSINIQTLGASWLSEVNIRFGNSDFTFDGPWPDTFRPGEGIDTPGTANFTGFFETDFHLNPDSEFHVELFESFDDLDGEPDAILLPGSTMTLTYFIPAPGAASVLGLAGLVLARRRR